MAFVQRWIDISFSYPGGSLSITAPRASVFMENAGGTTVPQANIRIHGLSRAHLGALSSYQQMSPTLRNSTVTVSAGDDKYGMNVAFSGMIIASWADMTGSPDVALNVQAVGQTLQAITPTNPTSFSSGVQVSQVMQNLASKAGFGLVNSGVNVTLSRPYLWGTPLEQINQVAIAANINWSIDNSNQIITIWPKGGNNGSQIINISAETGMVKYPAFNGTGVVVTTLYNPLIKYGNQIIVKSDLQSACGTFICQGLNHHIESQTPDGAWFTQIMGYYPPG